MLKIYSNKENNLFSIGNEEDMNFDGCSVENLCGSQNVENNEVKLVKLLKKYGAKITYINITKGKKTTGWAYKRHFKNYNSDVLLIIPFATFKNKEDALKCKNYLEGITR